jgi:hypothetical protein
MSIKLSPEDWEKVYSLQKKNKESKKNKETKVTQSSLKMDEYNRINKIDEKDRTPEQNAYVRKYLGYPEKTIEQKDEETYQKEYKKQQVRLDKKQDRHTEAKYKDMKEQIMSAPLNVPTQLKLEHSVAILKTVLENSGWERDENGKLVKTVNEGEKTKLSKEEYIQNERRILQIQNQLNINDSNVKKQTNRDIGSIIDELHKAVV